MESDVKFYELENDERVIETPFQINFVEFYSQLFVENLRYKCFHFNKKKVMFIDNKRVVVIKQSIMIFTVEKQYELSLIIGILLKH